MRVGLLIYGQLDQLSGGYLYDRMLTSAWQANGHQVEVISLPDQGYRQNLLHNLDRRWRDRLAQLKLDVLVQDELCHPSLFRLNHQLQPLIQYPIVTIVHHLRSQEIHRKTIVWLYRWVERRYLSSVDGFIFNSGPTRHSVEAILGHPTSGVIIPPGKDHLLGERSQEERGKERASKTRVLRLLFVGNLIRRKGLHWLLDSLETLESESWELSVVGRTDLEPTYAQAMITRMAGPTLENRVHFHGAVLQHELIRFYQRSDVLVVPSSHEGFGLVYLEAMGYGLPVIASQAGGASDLVTQGVNGYLIQPGDTDELSRRLLFYLQDRHSLIEHGRAALRRFAEHPSWAETAERAQDYIQRAFSSI